MPVRVGVSVDGAVGVEVCVGEEVKVGVEVWVSVISACDNSTVLLGINEEMSLDCESYIDMVGVALSERIELLA